MLAARQKGFTKTITTLATTLLVAGGAYSGALAALVPSVAQAASGYRLSIAVAPNPDVSGDPLTLVGTLTNSRGLAVQGIHLELYHRVNPIPVFAPIQRTRTAAGGLWQINRAEGVVVSNREWYVVARGPEGRFLARSPIARERVYAELTFSTSAPTALTGHPVTFSGTVSPRHAHERVMIERQVGTAGTAWKHVGVAVIAPSGAFSFTHAFARPDELGPDTLRAVLPSDARNIRSYSEPIQVTVEQAQNMALTLSPSAPTVLTGQPVTLTGRLVSPVSGGVSGALVTLYGHVHGQPFTALATTTSGPEGTFTFTQAPVNNTAYKVKAGGRVSATVFEGARDTLTATPSSNAGTVGQRITISGPVVPAHVGHVLYLQLRNSAGHYQTIQFAFVGAGSTYTIDHQLQSAGPKTYRVYIPGGPENIGAASEPFTVNVGPAAVLPALEPTPTPEG
ncbi:MAG: hypothetical protein ACYDA6_03030 [Solirubrobacteraceae bacterium]